MLELVLMDTMPLREEEAFEKALECVSQRRREKTMKYRFMKDRALSLGAALSLDALLKMRGLREKDMHYLLGEHEKPSFEGHPELFFNLSHSGCGAAAVISDLPIGIDLEETKEARLPLARHFFTGKEYEAILAAGDDKEMARVFTRIWTLKESFTKVTGQGLSLDLGCFEISFGGEKSIETKESLPAYIEKHRWEDEDEPWQMTRLNLSGPSDAVVSCDKVPGRYVFYEKSFLDYHLSLCLQTDP